MIVDGFSIPQVWTLKNNLTYIEGHHIACHLIDIIVGDHKFEYAYVIYPHLDVSVDPPQ